MDDEAQSGMNSDTESTGSTLGLDSVGVVRPLVLQADMPRVSGSYLTGTYGGIFDWAYYWGDNIYEALGTLIPWGETYVLVPGPDSSLYLLLGDGIVYNESTGAITGSAQVYCFEHSLGEDDITDEILPYGIWRVDYGELSLNLTRGTLYSDSSAHAVTYGSFEGMMKLPVGEWATSYIIGICAICALFMYTIGKLFRYVLRGRNDEGYG